MPSNKPNCISRGRSTLSIHGGRKRKTLLLGFCLIQFFTVVGSSSSTGLSETLPSAEWSFQNIASASGDDDRLLIGTPSSDDEGDDLDSSSDFEEVFSECEPNDQTAGYRATTDNSLDRSDGEEESESSEDDIEEGDWTEDDEPVPMEPSETKHIEEPLQNDIAVAGTPTDTEAQERPGASPAGETEEMSASQPLQTLEKLRQMLDETDYITASPSLRAEDLSSQGTVSHLLGETEANALPVVSDASPRMKEDELSHEKERLWTSKDRMKYKKQQERLRRARKEQRRLQQQLRSPPLHPNSDDDFTSEETDDGLGYTLPNLPVYFSDTEGATDTTDMEPPPLPPRQPQGVTSQPPPPPFVQQEPQHFPPPPYHPPYGGHPYPHNIAHPYMGYPPNGYYPYGHCMPFGQPQPQAYASQYAAWAAGASYGSRAFHTRPSYASITNQRKSESTQATTVRPLKQAAYVGDDQRRAPAVSSPDSSCPEVSRLRSETLNEMEVPRSEEIVPRINFDSLQKFSVVGLFVVLLAYCSVSPRTLPHAAYNAQVGENLKHVSLALIAPLISFSLVFDTKENDLNESVSAFYTSFTVGYCLAFVLELVLTTLLRLGVFAWWEPQALNLTPRVPALVLPWVLRENGYRPKRITLFAADFVTSCVAAPIVEEYVKLKILQLSVRLPKNFQWIIKKSSKRKKKRKVAEEIPRGPGEPPLTNINSYVTQMLATSMGLKFCDATRRILMYTKGEHSNKGFYAVCRGIFPIHELCGTMTALALAQRDVLGVNMPLWKMLLPAVVIHGMANFRGMKPIFKWNSSTPWSEMQLSPLSTAESLARSQLLNKGFAKLMWWSILGRVLGYCIKNYYLIRRQATKRTTTYAGKHSAFSAELAAAEMLKKTKEK